MERGILDTSVLIAEGLEPIPGRLAISVVSMAELQFGILVAKTSDARAQRLSRMTVLQRRFDPLPVDDAVAESYGRLAARVVDIGRQPRGRVLDLMIAATAHAHEAKLYTLNPDDFRGLEDLVEVVSL
ncbi:type II toxin-antitoxin system VapC family toxin [Kineosporia sp. NBRC 101731]|uniref:type II toxin-antitoxin system VapC family toxin n=1 Tax=Kineosporia sp. NBRC 101731 TaxID=3032199 RepID=UPI0024A5C912|nr:type II toxin-antitoxin system VapC family toxin [Kineosporia sp. NBRC 101731]GLY33473.1 ribonuclease VapC [Kineosporia sp. NBRC 101731]